MDRDKKNEIKIINDLKHRIDKMKNCYNCEYGGHDEDDTFICNKCDIETWSEWKLTGE